jgi:hypothetical protein
MKKAGGAMTMETLRKIIIGIAISSIMMLSVPSADASISRLYVGELDSQFMAGVDAKTEFDGFFVGGDIRTVIRKAVMNEDDRTVGFLPDRTDYKLMAGVNFEDGWSVELSHVCYHRVISSTDLTMYATAKVNEIENTDIITIKCMF